MLKVKWMPHLSRVPPEWHRLPMLCLWQEDECTRSDPSAEHIDDAITRIAGSMYDNARRFTLAPSDDERGVIRHGPIINYARVLGTPLAYFDGGDAHYRLYARGYVVIDSFDGASLHRLVALQEA